MREFVDASQVSYQDIMDDQTALNKFMPCPPSGMPGDHIQDSKGSYTDWRLPILSRTNYFKEMQYPFLVFAGCSHAFPKSAIKRAGKYDEDFQDWGGEDIEFGYRLFNEGYYFIPLRECVVYHQESIGETKNFQIDRIKGFEELLIMQLKILLIGVLLFP